MKELTKCENEFNQTYRSIHCVFISKFSLWEILFRDADLKISNKFDLFQFSVIKQKVIC